LQLDSITDPQLDLRGPLRSRKGQGREGEVETNVREEVQGRIKGDARGAVAPRPPVFFGGEHNWWE